MPILYDCLAPSPRSIAATAAPFLAGTPCGGFSAPPKIAPSISTRPR